MNNENEWYKKTEAEALQEQRSALEHGISHEEAGHRRVEFGHNVILEAKRRGPWRILLSQFSDFLVLVLIGAAIIAGFLGEPQDTVAIVAIILLNAGLGFIQEYRAEKAIEALKALASPQAKVRRMGEIILVPAHELVPGDIVLLESGNIVPADLRIIEAFQFQIDESALTGESQPVNKLSRALMTERLGVADQTNMAFKGTVVAAGRATGLVVRTGMATELGRIAKLLKEEVDVKTPLQQRLARFAKGLALVVLALCAVIFLVGVARGERPVLMFMTAVSLAVAAIPEALPAVVTVSLALGARVMSRQKALIRKLPAVESLGSVTVICSDKTGTLTENRMRLRGLQFMGSFFSEIPKNASSEESWQALLQILALNNDVTFAADGELQGDPTETALVEAALSSGMDKRALEKQFPRIAEFPFTSERGMMSTVHLAAPDQGFVLMKGAPEKVMPLCQTTFALAGIVPFDRDVAAHAVEELAAKGFRVLALARRALNEDPSKLPLEGLESKFDFVGLVGLIDPPRSGVKQAIAACHSAGVRVVMITGDHPVTALAIGEQLGILQSGRPAIMSGRELSTLEEDELQKKVLDVAVYARVAPEQKIRIVKALKSQGQIVAMTGDGVNDAPALKSADVGVAMGKGGTDVAREASHVILLDDNFATIVAAVREGRRIYDNIRKFVRFALSGNSGEIWTLFLAPFLGLPTPLLPIHILWVNLVTDGLPGLALALEPEEKDIMSRRPRHPQESVFARGLWQHALWVGILTAASTLGTMAWAFHTGHAHWQSMAFTVLTLIQMGHVMAIRSEKESLFTLGLRSNLPLLGAVILTFGLQLCTLYLQPLNQVFKTEPLAWDELLICCLASSSVFIAVEMEKWLRRRGFFPEKA
jgi:Ca2+-transporting ATPase